MAPRPLGLAHFLTGLILLLVLSFAFNLNAQDKEMQPQLIKSIIIHQILNHIQWQNDVDIKSIKIAYLGDDQILFEQLKNTSKKIQINGKSTVIEWLDDDKIRGEHFQVIYIGKSKVNQVEPIANTTRRTNTLIISDESPSKQDFMINFYETPFNTFEFEVNRTNIVFEHITMDKELLLLGGTELDVAELFRESEYRLQQIKSSLADKEAYLQQQNKKLQQNKLELNKQTRELNLIKSRLKDKEIQLKSQQGNLSILNSELQQSKSQLEENNAQLTLTQSRFQAAIKQQQQRQEVMKTLEQAIDINKQTLNEQVNKLTEQKQLIAQQGNTIGNQRYLLMISLAVISGFAILMYLLFRTNRARKKANVSLKQAYHDMAIVSQIGMEINASLDFVEIAESLYRNINKLMDAQAFAIALYKRDQNILKYTFVVEKGVNYKPFVRHMEESNQLAVWCIHNEKEVFINNVELEADNYVEDYQVSFGKPDPENDVIAMRANSLIYLPIISKNHVLGMLAVQSEKKNAYCPHDLDILRTVSAYGASAFENSISYRKLENAQQNLVMHEKMASLGTLTAGVVHEVNNPVNFVHGGAQNMQTDLADFKAFIFELASDSASAELTSLINQKFEQLFGHLKNIFNGSDRIKAVVSSLRNYSRLDENEMKDARLVEGLESTLELVKTKYKSFITFEKDYQDDPILSCSPSQLNQVFMNLIINGCFAIQEKRKTIDNFKGVLKVSTQQTSGILTISIADNGCGIPQSILHKIFDPFFTTKTVGDGSGLGLAICYEIIDKHKGQLSVESEVGIGTIFTILLPIERTEAT